jgi:hypothetical protein
VLSAAMSLGPQVTALAVASDEDEREQIIAQWAQWKPGVRLEVILSPSRALVRSVLQYVQALDADAGQVVVLVCEVQPRKLRHDLLHNQRGRLMAAVLRARTEAVVATLPYRLHD